MQYNTKDKFYADRLAVKQLKGWKECIRSIDPYGIHLRYLRPGNMLEIGCGIGRNLNYVDSHGIGIDHNEDSIQLCRIRGFKAFTTDEFEHSVYNKPQTFDSLLFSHVMEHMKLEQAIELLLKYKPLLRKEGQLLIFTPQEKGYDSDTTHVEFMDFFKLEEIGRRAGFYKTACYSFPFPRLMGWIWIYNEFFYQGKLL